MGEVRLKEIVKRVAPLVREELSKNFPLLPNLEREEILITQFLEGKRECREGVEKIVKGNLPYPLIHKLLESLKVKILERVVIENRINQRDVEELNRKFRDLER